MKKLFVVLICFSAFVAAQAKRNITETDIYAFHWIANAQISPDGSQVIYTEVKVTPKHDNYETSMWIVSTEPRSVARPFTSHNGDGGATWSPDGKSVAFVRAPEGGRGQIYVLAMDGGEAR